MAKQNKWQGLVNAIYTGVLITDRYGDILYANEIAANFFGKDISDIVGTNFSYPLSDLDVHEIEVLGPKKQIVNLQATIRKGGWENHFAWIITLVDISEQKKFHSQLNVISQGFAAMSDGFLITDEHGTILEVNDALLKMTGYEANEMIGQNTGILISGKKSKLFYTRFWSRLIKTGEWCGKIVDRKKNLQTFAVFLKINAVKNADGEVVNYIGLYHDLSEIKEKEKEIAQSKLYDLLTGYANRHLLTLKVHQLIEKRRGNQDIIILHILVKEHATKRRDLITDDMLTIEMTKRLNIITNERYLAARIGPKEFVFVFLGDWTLSALNQLAQDIIDVLAKPFQLKNKIFNLSSVVGIATYNECASFSAEEFLNQAANAQTMASQCGANRYAHFDPQVIIKALEFNKRLNAIRNAIKHNELELYYQPKVNLMTGKVVGVEALLRWHHPKQGVLLPYQFIHNLDGHPISIELGNWVLNAALQFGEQLLEQNHRIQISYNVSSCQLQENDFIPQVEALLAKHPKFPREMILLEILETEAIRDLDKVSDLIEECGLKKIFFSLDDFGTGYSSLSYLKTLQTTQVKIDQRFIRNVLTNVEDIAILKTTIDLCRLLGRELIAEGVETPTHAKLLFHLGCNLIQGYGIAMPMPEHELLPWLNNFRLSKEYKKTAFSKKACSDLLAAIIRHGSTINAIKHYLQTMPSIKPNINYERCPLSTWFSKYEPEFKDKAIFNKLEAWHRLIHTESQQIIVMSKPEDLPLAYEQLNKLKDMIALFIQELLLTVF